MRPNDTLPQMRGGPFLTDGGLETTLIFHEGWELPCGEAFTLVETERGRQALRNYFDRYLPIAAELGAGFILESPTWRANPDWGAAVGYSRDRLAEVNRASIALMREIQNRYAGRVVPIVVSGNIGPRGDGYNPDRIMTPAEAQDYHAWQIEQFRVAGADCVTAMTLTNVEEALGVARAAAAAQMPCIISFTVETGGRLPTGVSLGEAIETVDRETNSSPAYYMVNCAHPTHFAPALDEGAAWSQRLRGLRANASCRSHAELDNSPTLDTGNPEELGQQYARLRRRFPHINVLGGCCGTDHRHVQSVANACFEPSRRVARDVRRA